MTKEKWVPEKHQKELDSIIDRGNWINRGTQYAKFLPLQEDAPRFYELVDLKAAFYWEEYKNAR